MAAGMLIVFLRSNVFHHYSTSIWLSYIPACSHIGALWEFSSAQWQWLETLHRTRRTTPLNLYYYCHLRGGQIWPRWPSDLSKACVPGGVGWGENAATTPSFYRDEFSCDIYVCILMLRDCLGPSARTDGHLTTTNQPGFSNCGSL